MTCLEEKKDVSDWERKLGIRTVGYLAESSRIRNRAKREIPSMGLKRELRLAERGDCA